MGKPQAGEIAIFGSETRQAIDGRNQFGSKEFQTASHENQVGIIGHVATGGSEMNDRFGRGADIAKRVDMRHHVMSEQFFVMGRRDEIDLIDMLPQFINLRLSDIQS